MGFPADSVVKESIWQNHRHRFNPWHRTFEKEMVTHSSILLAWETPWTEEPSGLKSMRLQNNWKVKDEINLRKLLLSRNKNNEYLLQRSYWATWPLWVWKWIKIFPQYRNIRSQISENYSYICLVTMVLNWY